MIFTIEQYDKAIENLTLAKQQHVDGTTDKGCGVCGGNCHPDLCGFNPLHAMRVCNEFSKNAAVLHNQLHNISGFHTYMGEPVGVASVIDPKALKESNQ